MSRDVSRKELEDAVAIYQAECNRLTAELAALREYDSRCVSSVVETMVRFPNVGEYIRQVERENEQARALLARWYGISCPPGLEELFNDTRAFLATSDAAPCCTCDRGPDAAFHRTDCELLREHWEEKRRDEARGAPESYAEMNTGERIDHLAAGGKPWDGAAPPAADVDRTKNTISCAACESVLGADAWKHTCAPSEPAPPRCTCGHDDMPPFKQPWEHAPGCLARRGWRER